ncbi:bacteriophage N4 adsorption protein A [Paraburkholderia sp. CNPSo 3076]|uniref:NfrA family protein n=1 Tax=Paraburkholderia sp. CNPSo 3076 TaxID=2940936 RepID=UPI002255F2C3|nr:bacteriophage N4 adsorption protein A [Paraburkholderia sp. CNPSo 3076]MCX5542641.1 bacteriophage N4 adsorption protein A [Paraburkholderia sp. CNPSo 3076]
MPRALLLAALWAALAGAGRAQAQALPQGTQPLPLSGAAYRVAQQGYDAYARRDYAAAERYAREAIRQRPDLATLRLLLANSQAARGQWREASRTLSDAIAQIGPDAALAARRREVDAQVAALARPGAPTGGGRTARAAPPPGSGPPDYLTGRAWQLAQDAYKSYGAKQYDTAWREAGTVIALRPDILRLQLLAIDAAAAGGHDREAWQAAQDAQRRFGDSQALRERRTQIGARLAPAAVQAAQAARARGDTAQAIARMHEAIGYAPSHLGNRLLLCEMLLEQNDMAGLEAAAGDAIASGATPTLMPYVLRGYARAAQGRSAQANEDFAQALLSEGASVRDERVAHAIIADVWTAEGQPQRALDLLATLPPVGDDTDALIAMRRYYARAALAQSAAPTTPATPGERVATTARPVLDCTVDRYGSACDIYAADPGFAQRRAAIVASQRGDQAAALDAQRRAVAADPRNPQHRLELIDALTAAGDTVGAQREARAMADAGLLDALPPLSAAYVAQRAGDDRRAATYFAQADEAGQLPPQATGDAGYSAYRATFDALAASYFRRAIDYGTSPPPGVAPATLVQLQDLRNAHADVTRDWGAIALVNYRGSGLQPGVSTGQVPGSYNNWQMGVEGYWRPFGTLGDRNFEVYARVYQDVGAKGDAPSGISTALGAIGARAKPFESINAVVAFERLIPIGSRAPSDWLLRLAYSGGIGTERRLDVPSWWTVQDYGEVGHYVSNGWNYGTGYIEAGRTWRLDTISPKLTVFPYAVAGVDYDSSINHSVPVGMGVGVSTRYWFRDSFYDAPRSYVDVTVQYRWHITGDDRAGGVFFGAVLSY